jgi:cytochrome c oxidase subunit 2
VLRLWRILFATAVVLGVLVVGLIGWSVIRYRRRRPGGGAGLRGPNAGTGLGATFSENVPLELFYTAVPLVIVAVLFGITLGVQNRVTRLAAEPDVRVEVTGFQWGWRFHYLTEGVTVLGTSNEAPTMVLPVDATVRLVLLSPDVIHSFYVPEFLGKRDTVPGVENRIDVTTTRTGRFPGMCAEFCGLDHARMTFTVEVVRPEQFQAFVAEQRQQEEEQTGNLPDEQNQGQENPGGQAAPPAPTRAPTTVRVS